MGFSRQEYWSGLPFPSPGDLPNPGIKSASPMSPELQANSLPLAIGEAHRGSCHRCNTCDTGSGGSLPRSPGGQGAEPWPRLASGLWVDSLRLLSSQDGLPPPTHPPTSLIPASPLISRMHVRTRIAGDSLGRIGVLVGKVVILFPSSLQMGSRASIPRVGLEGFFHSFDSIYWASGIPWWLRW